MRREEREVVWEEVTCQTVEYEYEVLGNERRLLTHRNLGQTVSVTVSSSPYFREIGTIIHEEADQGFSPLILILIRIPFILRLIFT